ncbi:type II secretion system protein N [Alloalcanivorax xenomutans]|uniref:type II secretion system protein N n=1 Tax=Alloalcanivorax xenomutans TaxID=1094342 RepID=UPI0006D5BF57|nr:type II secretion system protein N [Alloalcanivorax xenomutans]CUR46091.1 General secretion pathway protein C [Alloalcanivorax xenomutans]
MIQWAQRGNTRQWLPPLRLAVMLLLLVGLAYLIAQTVWLLSYGPNDPVPESGLRTVSASGQGGERRGISPSEMESWNLFGVYQAQEEASDKPVDAPDTRLKLQLLGVFRSLDRTQSSAIVAESGGDAELYRIGDALPGNATVEEIYADRIILKRVGQLETLRLSELAALGGVSVSSRPPPPPPPRRPQEPAPPAEADLGQQRTTLIRQLGLKAVTSGESQGYSLGSSAPKQLIEQVGLNQGDVILSVNGYPLGTEENDLAALQSFQESQSATIVVQRGDQEFTVSYPP